jgi:hypothetical protein
MRKLVQNGTMTRMMSSDLQRPVRVARKYANGIASTTQMTVPSSASCRVDPIGPPRSAIFA